MFWLAVFAAAAPWFRVEWGGTVLYPGHWLLSAGLAVLLLREGRGAPGGRVPLKWGLLLGAWLCLLAGLRGQWGALAVIAGAVAANWCWGVAAYRLGRSRAGAGSAPDGLVLLLAAGLAVGLATWVALWLWPPLCRGLNCPEAPPVPYPFYGGWNGSAQYLLLLLLMLPLATALLLVLHRDRRARGRRNFLAAILAACTLALLAGAQWWAALLLAVALTGAVLRMRPLARRGDGRLVRGALLAAAAGGLALYGLFPAYLGALTGAAGPSGLARIEYAQPPPARLSSARETVLRVRVVNAGLSTLPRGSAIPLRLRPRLMITPERGGSRAFRGRGVTLPGTLGPGRGREVELPVRLPHWAREGFLAWRLEDGAGRGIALEEHSNVGFRFVNPDFRPLTHTRENLLTAMAARAREFGRFSRLPEALGLPSADVEKVLGGLLDTLVFSPLWGLGPPRREGPYPFASPQPFWTQLLREYGLIGLLLAGGLFAGTLRRAARVRQHAQRPEERVLWLLAPWAVLLIGAVGFFSPVLGSFHGVWGLFLFAGYVEGRHAYWFAQQPVPRAKKSLWPWQRPARRGRRYKPPKRRRLSR